MNLSNQRHFIIGDIQGCYDAMCTALEAVGFCKQTDCLWCIGDVVNRGGQSLQVLEYLYHLPNRRLVLGNHDIHLLRLWKTGITPPHKDRELTAILASPNRKVLLKWLLQQPLIHSEVIAAKTHTMVHAGWPPIWSLEQAQQYAAQLQTHLQQLSAQGWVNIWGNSPARFADADSKKKQMRYILNALTRIRYVQANGTLQLSSRRYTLQFSAFRSWFHFPLRTNCDYVYFGHWAALQRAIGINKEDVIYHGATKFTGTDSGYVWGGKLTIINMQTQEVFNIAAKK